MDSPNRHNGGPLSDEDGRKLWDHVRALEVLEEQKAEVQLDITTRKQLAKADGFDTNIVAAILKRRKIGAGETRVADDLVRLYEEALTEQGAMPLEDAKRHAPVRTSTAEIAEKLHQQPSPANPRIDAQEDALYDRAKHIVTSTAKASTSFLQRQLEVGYNTAARMIERMERDGIVSPPDHIGRRAVTAEGAREAVAAIVDGDPF